MRTEPKGLYYTCTTPVKGHVVVVGLGWFASSILLDV